MYDHRAALVTLRTALAIGIAADLLLRWIPWGVNAPLFTLCLLGAALTLIARVRPQPIAAIAFPAAAAILLAATVAWRDSTALALTSVILAIFAIHLLSLPARGIRATAAGLAEIALALVTTSIQSIGGVILLCFADLRWRSPSGRTATNAVTLIRGVLLAFPVLLIFGGLLISADVAFAELMMNVAKLLSPAEVLGHGFVIVVATLAAGGFLRSLLAGGEVRIPGRPGFLKLGAAEVNIAFTLINLLFVIFVAVQFRYFFGGTSLISIDPSLTYAAYARRGFFELVTLVALVVPLLLVAEWLIDKSDAGKLRGFRALALLQVGLVFVIVVSAYQRMQIYRDEYGLTELRLYTTAFMLWLAALLVWLAATVLTGRRQRFASGAIASGIVALLALHAINPDRLIVRTNVDRAVAGRRALDIDYNASLSADARLALFEMRHLLPEAQRARIERQLLSRHAPKPPGWRTWNLARWREWHVVEAWRS